MEARVLLTTTFPEKRADLGKGFQGIEPLEKTPMGHMTPSVELRRVEDNTGSSTIVGEDNWWARRQGKTARLLDSSVWRFGLRRKSRKKSGGHPRERPLLRFRFGSRMDQGTDSENKEGV